MDLNILVEFINWLVSPEKIAETPFHHFFVYFILATFIDYISWHVFGFEEEYKRTLVEKEIRWMLREKGGLLLFIISIGLEEVVFRGFPYIVSSILLAGAYKMELIYLGSIIWALLHRTPGSIAICMILIPFYAGLWIMDLGLMAIMFHILQNLINLIIMSIIEKT